MYVTIYQLLDLGVSRSELEARVSSGEWQTSELSSSAAEGDEKRSVLISSLTQELQIKWMQAHALAPSSQQVAGLLVEAERHGMADREAAIVRLLLHLSVAERFAWLTEAVRLAQLVERYDRIKPKSRRSSATGKPEFVAGVLELCREAACQDPLILARQPHRGAIPSPHTLYGWLRSYRRDELLTEVGRQ